MCATLVASMHTHFIHIELSYTGIILHSLHISISFGKSSPYVAPLTPSVQPSPTIFDVSFPQFHQPCMETIPHAAMCQITPVITNLILQ